MMKPYFWEKEWQAKWLQLLTRRRARAVWTIRVLQCDLAILERERATWQTELDSLSARPMPTR